MNNLLELILHDKGEKHISSIIAICRWREGRRRGQSRKPQILYTMIHWPLNHTTCMQS